jgi:hypothetical protein
MKILHSVPKGPKSGKLKTRKGRASLKTRKGRASLKTRKGRTSFKTREGLVIIKTSKASLNLKRALWGDKPSGLLPENCPNFSFFFVWAGTLWALVTSPKGPEKLKFFQGNLI